MSSVTLEKILTDRDIQQKLIKILEDFKSNIEWVERNWDKLLLKYPDRHIAVSNCEVIGSGKSRARLEKRIERKYNEIPSDMWVEYITAEKPKYLF